MMRKLFVIILLLPLNGWSATYYIRSDGTVTAAGKASATSCSSASTALSMAEHNNASYTAGDDFVLCHEGGIFTTSMNARVSGVDNNNRSTIASSSGSRAVIDLRTTISTSGWTEVVAGQRYSLAHGTATPTRVFVDGAEWQYRSSASAVDASGEWHWASNVLYLGGPNPSSYTSIKGLPVTTTQAFDTNAKNYLSVSNVDFYGGTRADATVTKSNYVTFDNCSFKYGKNGLQFSGDTGTGNDSTYIIVQNSVIGESDWNLNNAEVGVNDWDGIRFMYEVSNVQILNNFIYNFGHGGIEVDGSSYNTYGGFSNIAINGNDISGPGLEYGSAMNVYGPLNETTAVTVTNNYIHDIPNRVQVCGNTNSFIGNVVKNVFGSTRTGNEFAGAPGTTNTYYQSGPNIWVACEDITISHNTFYSTKGPYTITHAGTANDCDTETQTKNITYTNNVLYMLTDAAIGESSAGPYGLFVGNTATLPGGAADSCINSLTIKNNIIYNTARALGDEIAYQGVAQTVSELDALDGGDNISGNLQQQPLLTSSSDLTLQYLSPAIDGGTTSTQISDKSGNPIWGAPDIGAYEYQPPYTIGTHALTAPSARIYQGDQEGRFRALAASTGTCPVEITPSGGTWNDLSATDVRPAFGDVTNLTCPSTKKVSFTFTPASSISNPVFRYRGARGQTYQVKVGGVLAGSSIIGCQKSNCLADKNGNFSFAWNGSLAVAKTFEIVTGGKFQGTISHRIDRHPNE